ncbi:MAG: hypothetical protein IJV83_00060 [Clostridia bacterium]|nr:hypothetical protein [Clostridia bacterium]
MKKFLRFFLFWKNKRYVILVFYQGKAEHFSMMKFAKTHTRAVQKAADLIENTIGWQALIYRWDPFAGRVEHYAGERNTFPKTEVALERKNKPRKEIRIPRISTIYEVKKAKKGSEVLPGQIGIKDLGATDEKEKTDISEKSKKRNRAKAAKAREDATLDGASDNAGA